MPADFPFDNEVTQRISEARWNCTTSFLPSLIQHQSLQTALDVGCGIGYFASYLAELGLQVTALDGRQENVDEGKRRLPHIRFLAGDIEDSKVAGLGSFDLVLAYGLLYHLENPLRALRNLFCLTGKILLLESMVAPSREAIGVMVDECQSFDQGLNYRALILSESALVKALYGSGFTHVLAPTILPAHEHYSPNLLRKKVRIILVASKTNISDPLLKRLPEPPPVSDREYRYRRWVIKAARIAGFIR